MFTAAECDCTRNAVLKADSPDDCMLWLTRRLHNHVQQPEFGEDCSVSRRRRGAAAQPTGQANR